MRDIRGWTGILTGASRGLGPYMARTLAGAGVRLALVARSREELEALARELGDAGHDAAAVPADLSDPASLAPMLEVAERALGPPDLLVNNAGIGITHRYHTLPEDRIGLILQLNLATPMVLTRRVLPGMVERGRGHVVNIASLAGHAYPPYHEGYAATKAGLIGFSRSLRGAYRGSGVGVSVVSPGFVRDAGMFQRAVEEAGVSAPAAAGTVSPEEVAEAVLDVVLHDRPEVIVAPAKARTLVAALRPFPRLAEAALERMGVVELYRRRALANEGAADVE